MTKKYMLACGHWGTGYHCKRWGCWNSKKKQGKK